MEKKYMIKKLDFTSCRRLLGKAYNGANGKKIQELMPDVVFVLEKITFPDCLIEKHYDA